MTADTIIDFLSILPQFPLMGYFIGRFIRAERLWLFVLLFTGPVSAAYALTAQWPMVRWLVTFALFLAFIFLTARIPRRFALLHLIIGILLMFAVSLLVTMAIGLIYPTYARLAEIPQNVVIMLRLVTLPLLAVVWLVNNRLCGRLFRLGADHELKRYTPFLVLECALLLVAELLTMAMQQTDTLSLLLDLAVIAGFFLLDVLLANTLRRLDLVHDAELRQQQALELLRDQAGAYSSLQENTAAVRRLRHDMVNQLQGISYLLKSGDTARASALLHAYLDAVAGTERQTFTGYAPADAVIGAKTDTMHDAGIAFCCTGTLSEDYSVDDAVLCGLLSRLLDNAVRGCMLSDTAKKRTVSLRIGTHGDRVVLRCENTCPPDAEPPAADRQEDDTVWDPDLLRRIAEANGGDAVFEHKDGTFTAVIRFRADAESKGDAV